MHCPENQSSCSRIAFKVKSKVGQVRLCGRLYGKREEFGRERLTQTALSGEGMMVLPSSGVNV